MVLGDQEDSRADQQPNLTLAAFSKNQESDFGGFLDILVVPHPDSHQTVAQCEHPLPLKLRVSNYGLSKTENV
jgi:hypothetical protein